MAKKKKKTVKKKTSATKKKNSIKKIAKRNKFILVGSSMGAWISLNQFKYFKNQIVGFVG